MKTQRLSLFFSLLAASALFLQSCRTHGPAFSANADPYLAKPTYHGNNEGAFYLSGRYNKGYEYYADEKNNSTELAGHVSFMTQYFYISGGLFGFWGNYDVNAAVSPASGGGKQGFNGGGGRVELGGRIPLENNFDLLLGFNGEIYTEGGEFAENNSDIFRTYPNLAPALDLRYAPAGKWDIGLRYTLDSYIATTNVLDNNSTRFLHRLTLHNTYDRVTAYGQIGFTADAQRVFSLGLSYGIPFRKSGKEKS